MTNGISTSPHCLYKSNIVDDVIINKTKERLKNIGTKEDLKK